MKEVNPDQSFTAKTMQGLEEVLAKELEDLGARGIEIGNRAVTFQGNQKLAYKAILGARTALTVLSPINGGVVRNEDDLYQLVQETEWFSIFDVKKTIYVNMVCYSTLFRNTHYLALRVKDAIVDQFRAKVHRRPSVSKTPDVKIDIFIRQDQCTISLDLVGRPLFKRGYRLERGSAPLNEVLAAGLLHLLGWDASQPLVDPMCGSGTIPIEAYLMAQNIHPQFLRDDFSFQHLQNYRNKLFRETKEELRSLERNAAVKISGFDIDAKMVRRARGNALNCGLQHISWKKKDFFSWVPKGPPGVVLFNPPYDERLSLEDATAFYTDIGDHLKGHFAGWKAFVISSHLQAIKRIGLRPFIKKTLYNGPLECRWVGFDLYLGKKEN